MSGVLLAILLCSSSAFGRDGVKHTCPMGRDYFLFAPAKPDPAKTYWLVVGVHGAGGSGKDMSGLGSWLDRGDCIAVAPSFPSGYQLLEKETDPQLLGIVKELGEKYKLHPKLFVTGHSGGAQFAHRFTIAHPDLVMGCCATSAGSWATGRGWGDLDANAAGIPIAISCGEKDTELMAVGAPMGRLEWAKAFEKRLAEKEFLYKAKYWPGAGHMGDAKGNAQLETEAFSIGIGGLIGKQRMEIDARLKTIATMIAGKSAKSADAIAELKKLVEGLDEKQIKAALEDAGWHAGEAGVAACLKRVREYVAEETGR